MNLFDAKPMQCESSLLKDFFKICKELEFDNPSYNFCNGQSEKHIDRLILVLNYSMGYTYFKVHP